MSDNWLIVLPIDPLAKPSKERVQTSLDLLTALRPKGQEPELHMSEVPEFYYCGANFESVFCPFCQSDIEEWWHKAVGAWFEGNDRSRLAVETPCCGKATSLNDLDFDWPQGFACVAIELRNPDSDLEPEEVQQLEQALGSPVRIIWRHL